MAAGFLRKRGYRILSRRFRSPYGEIDIIAAKGRWTCFIEVKTRRSCSCGEPLEAVSFPKRRRLIRTALWYLNQHHQDSDAVPARFSVIGVLMDGAGAASIQMVENAFDLDGDGP